MLSLRCPLRHLVKCANTMTLLSYFEGVPLANHKSAAKRARQAVRKNKVNTSRKNTVRTFEKSLTKALTGQDKKALTELLKEFTSQMMKAAQRGIFKKEAASRKIARLSSRVQKVVGK